MLSRLIRSPIILARRARVTSSPIVRGIAIGEHAALFILLTSLILCSPFPFPPSPLLFTGSGITAFAVASRHDAAHLPRSLCNAQQQEPEQPSPVLSNGPKAGADSDASRSNNPGAGSPPGAACAAAVVDTALSMASAAAADASAAAAAAVAAALDAATAKHDPLPTVDVATSAAAVAEVIHEAGVARQPSVLDSHADAVSKLQQHAQVLVGDNQEVHSVAVVTCGGGALSHQSPNRSKLPPSFHRW
jgi:hypothetical protein